VTNNAEQLKQYWLSGAGAAKIRWGTPGDLTRCHRLVKKEVSITDMSDSDIWGFCQNLHIRKFGRPNVADGYAPDTEQG